MQLLIHPYNRFPAYLRSCSFAATSTVLLDFRHFEHVAAVARNKCIKRGSYSMHVHRQILSRSHFDSPFRCRNFEDVAAFAGNRRIKRGSYLMHVHGQTTIGVFFKNLDMLEKILSFSTSLAIKARTVCTVQSEERAD